MADIINAPDLPSEDEDDTDYDPSRDADKGDETRAKPKLGLKGRNKRLAGDTSEQSDGEEGDVAQEPKFCKAAAKRAKVEALWESMSGGGGKQKQGLGDSGSTAVGEPQGSKPAAGINWGSLCRPIRRAAAPEDKNRNWMLQLGLTGKKGGPGDKTTCLSQEHSSCTPKQEPQGIGAANGVQIAGRVEAKASPDDHSQEKPQNTAAAALAAAKAAVSSAGHGQVAVTETRRFAGKDIQVTKQVAVADAAAQAEADAARRKKAGLDSVLASLQAAKKVNVLDKSRSDWRDFKTSDAKVDDELEAYKKSNDKYLDKVDFLKRAELREYEKERDARLGGDIRSRGRL